MGCNCKTNLGMLMKLGPDTPEHPNPPCHPAHMLHHIPGACGPTVVPGDPLHPDHYPGVITQMGRPEPYYGVLKIVAAADTQDHQMTAVRYADGRYDMIPKGYIPDGANIVNNGPRVIPWDETRGNVSDSEGMDCLNYMFNNSDNGASF